MSCQHCVNAVAKALDGVDGITDVHVVLEKGEASFTETQPVTPEIIRKAIKKPGTR